MSSNKPWPKESVLRLQTMAALGFTYLMAAEDLGRSRSAVAGKVKRLGFRFKGDRGTRHKQDLETRIEVGAAARAARMAHAPIVRSITAEFCGDPAPGRSALDGWQQRGHGFTDAGHADSKRGVRKSQAELKCGGGNE